VEIAKSQDGGHWETVAKGTWEPGSDPVLKGESVPPAVLEDLVRIDPKVRKAAPRMLRLVTLGTRWLSCPNDPKGRGRKRLEG
jgi:hypothetical protein